MMVYHFLLYLRHIVNTGKMPKNCKNVGNVFKYPICLSIETTLINVKLSGVFYSFIRISIFHKGTDISEPLIKSNTRSTARHDDSPTITTAVTTVLLGVPSLVICLYVV